MASVVAVVVGAVVLGVEDATDDDDDDHRIAAAAADVEEVDGISKTVACGLNETPFGIFVREDNDDAAAVVLFDESSDESAFGFINSKL